MNRLQKKCLIATAGLHLLLVVILFVGPAFFYSRPKPDDAQLLDVIPSEAVEAALNSGVKNAQPPAPQPKQIKIVPPPPPIQSQPQPTPEPPAPKPEQTFVKKIEKIFKPDPTPAPKPTPAPDTKKTVEKKVAEKPTPHKIKVNLTQVTRSAPTQRNSTPSKSHDDSRRQKLRADAARSLVENLRDSFSSATEVEMPGTSSVSYAGYASIIKSKYTQAWRPPNNVADDEANTKVKITVTSDGTVISAHIIGPSGDKSVDDSVQQTLDRINFIAPFPDGAKEKQKTFIINFNLKAKRMLG